MVNGQVQPPLSKNAFVFWSGEVRELRSQAMLKLIGQLFAHRAQTVPSDAAWLPAQQELPLTGLKNLCEQHQTVPGKLGEVAREFLRDWQVIIRPLLDQDLPLTNNLAERALRHWVIARKISHGTRSAKGTRAFALLASLIDTSRLRGASAWDFLTDAIHAARHRLPMPPLPKPEQGV